MRALAAGKHVHLREAVHAPSRSEVDEAWDEAERHGLVLTEGYMWRHARQTRCSASCCRSVGELRAVHATFTAIARASRTTCVGCRDLGGGALLDVGCYCISAARLVTGGEPERVHGEAQLGTVGWTRAFAGTLRFEDVTATFQCGRSRRS